MVGINIKDLQKLKPLGSFSSDRLEKLAAHFVHKDFPKE
jgi:hypothetical protein